MILTTLAATVLTLLALAAAWACVRAGAGRTRTIRRVTATAIGTAALPAATLAVYPVARLAAGQPAPATRATSRRTRARPSGLIRRTTGCGSSSSPAPRPAGPTCSAGRVTRKFPAARGRAPFSWASGPPRTARVNCGHEPDRHRRPPHAQSNALKYGLSGRICEEPVSFFTPDAGRDHPVAGRLFGIKGVEGVLLLHDFVTINKTAAAKWKDITPAVKKVLGGVEVDAAID